MKHNPIICAIDTKNINDALALAYDIKSYVGFIKLGLEFFVSHGPQGILKMQKVGIPIFLDLKFHDIPNTVAECVRSATTLGVSIMTLHCSGGSKMLASAQRAATEEASRHSIDKPLLFGVTVLTSIDDSDLKAVGYKSGSVETVNALAALANTSKLDGIVCSAHEVSLVKKTYDHSLLTIVPGIRPEGTDVGDQKRVMTPKEALVAGADYLVIGRPITQSSNPKMSCKEIYESMEDLVS